MSLDDTPPKRAAMPSPAKKGGAAALAALREENADLKRRLAAVEAVRPACLASRQGLMWHDCNESQLDS